ncbi:MAG: hypothetical protein WCD86_21105 [Ktedonobacteraceae bacterium]
MKNALPVFVFVLLFGMILIFLGGPHHLLGSLFIACLALLFTFLIVIFNRKIGVW